MKGILMNQPWTREVLRAGAHSLGALKVRMDSWRNALSGLNTSRDKTSFMMPSPEMLLSPQMLEVLYSTDDISARIVSAIPDECFRKPWKIVSKTKSDEDAAEVADRGAVLAADLDLLGARTKLHEAMTWGRLYGLGAVLIGADDGQDPALPLNVSRVRSVRYLTVLDKRDLTPFRWYADPREPKFGDVAVYLVQPVGVFVGAPYDLESRNQMILVHESRLLRFGGELTSKRERLRNQASDYSVLQKCFRALQLTNNNWQSASALLADASQGVFKIKGLIDMISQSPDVMQTRMQLVDQMRSVVRALVLDTDEDFERKQTTFTGIPEILDKTWQRLASAARMPLTVLMGMSPGGFNATGESDLRWWYDSIAATQEKVVKPLLDYLLQIVATARRYENPETWTVAFEPLWQMSEKELAELHFLQAQADDKYVANGTLTPEEVGLSRFGGGTYSLETTIDVESRKRVMELSLQQMEAEAENALERAENPPQSTPGVISSSSSALEEAVESTPDPRPPGVVET